MASSLSMSFLRPMGLPRPTTLHRFFGAARLSTTSASTATPITPPPAAPKRHPYRITLTGTKNYPVYTLSKRGGNMKLTKLRRIEGDIEALRNDMQAALGMEVSEVKINQLTKHIIVKGHKKAEIEQFLKDQQL